MYATYLEEYLNKFCKNCPHLKVPKLLKDKFNKFNYPLFINSPITDELVVGCVVKYQNIEWSYFAEYIIKKKLLTKHEYEELVKYGWADTN